MAAALRSSQVQRHLLALLFTSLLSCASKLPSLPWVAGTRQCGPVPCPTSSNDDTQSSPDECSTALTFNNSIMLYCTINLGPLPTLESREPAMRSSALPRVSSEAA